VPVIDTSGFAWASPGDRADVGNQLDDACRASGAFTLVGHGVSPALTDDALEVTREFFRLPDPYKRQFASVSGSPYRGWRSKQVRGSASVGLREDFEVGRYDTAAALADAGYGPEWVALVEPNRWPPRPLGFRRTWTTLWAAMEQLGDRLLDLLAGSLGLPEGWFSSRFDRQVSYLAAHHYPPQLAGGRERVLRMGSHTSLGTLSILCQRDATQGLEIGRPSGGWAPVEVEPPGVVVCVGELLAQWTAGRWFAAPQRVRSLTDRDPALSRTSITFYQYPNLDALVDPTELATALGSEAPVGAARHGDGEEQVVAGWWSHDRMQVDLDL